MDRNWYRNTSWDEEIEKYFFTKLSRVRNEGMKAQYLKLQAASLAYKNDEKLMQVAEFLLSKLFTDYPDDKGGKSNAFNIMGDMCRFRNEYQKAMAYYKQAIDFEEIFPYSISNAFMNYAELVVKLNRTDLFEDVEKIFSEERYEIAIFFPQTKYLKYAMQSIISKYKGDIEKAKYYADLAEQNAAAEESGLRNHKKLGLVRERDPLLDKLMYMNRKELKSNLDKLGIREDSYSFYGGVDILKAILEWGIKWRNIMFRFFLMMIMLQSGISSFAQNKGTKSSLEWRIY
jgi:hypothetical protein